MTLTTNQYVNDTAEITPTHPKTLTFSTPYKAALTAAEVN